jgi:hypothetical protein
VPLAARLRYGTLVVLLSEEQLSVAEETVRCRLSVSSAIQMRGSISNCQSRRHSSLRKSHLTTESRLAADAR